jgi:formimidoylglutamate deiminase
MSEERLKYFRFDALLQQQGWIRPAFVGVDATGIVRYLSDTTPATAIAIEFVKGVALPGFPNGHSHAFQYAMAGMAEKHVPGSNDDFWTWRETMYDYALRMQPDQMEAVAARLYLEMLRKGYTHVAEFHYLHRDLNGRSYANLSETGERLLAAAETAGIRITLIPVFYQKGGFGKDAEIRQRRFISATVDQYLDLLQSSELSVKKYARASLGFGVHSLRAVAATDVFRTVEWGRKDLPFHLHAAEQLREVEDCLFYLKQRPVEWLLNNLPLKERFNIVHCTHLNEDETRRLAKTGATAVLCPGTEGNLGDGIFPLTEYARQYGNFCIGTDSHISLNPLEDLRWLDYGQRLTTHRRNTFDDGATVLMNKTIPCGRKAMGQSSDNFFAIDKPLDAVVYKSPVYVGTEHLLPTILYSSDPSSVLGTLVDGEWAVKNLVHKKEKAIQSRFEKAMKELLHGE